MRKIDSDQLDHFLRLLRDNLVDGGLEGSDFDKAVESATRQLLTPPSKDPVFTRQQDDSGLTSESRGMDSLGRILVEFCFFRTPHGRMIWPDNSEQDKTARRVFTEDCIPRPLMRYFLASIRGSISKLDRFEANSILAENGGDAHMKRKALVAEMLEGFKGPFGGGESAIDWDEVYADHRFQRIALELIEDILKKIQQYGLEQYLDILKGINRRDPDNSGINAMQRAFIIEDAQQIEEALLAAEKSLKRTTH